ncbi:MAG: class I SAM-dependent methyltransferase [bacterium]|nr:class I SAM-dependent methyltransferase [bacterium]
MSLPSKIKGALSGQTALRNAIRRVRWWLKYIPGVRNLSIAFDTWYFRGVSQERPDEHNGVIGDPYFESYAGVLAGKCRNKVLDLGCGHGFLTSRIAQNPAVTAIVGLDKINDFRSLDKKIIYQTQDLSQDAPLPLGFDTIVSSEFIEHISEEAFVKLLARVSTAIKPDGIFIGSTPKNPTPYKNFSGSKFHIREYNAPDLKKHLDHFFTKVSVYPVATYCLIWEASGKK